MSTHKISIRLSVNDIDKAINSIEKYQQELQNKCELFVKRLAETGIPVIDRAIGSTAGDSSTEHYTHIDIRHFQNYSSATLVLEGEDILFIEFGAGVHYNTAAGTSPHPLGEKLGYTIGSYGYGQGANDYWFYMAETGESVMSHGTRATKPMFYASKKIRDQMLQIAKEVFGNG